MWEPGGVLTKLTKWNGVKICREDVWIRRVIQRCVGDVTNTYLLIWEELFVLQSVVSDVLVCQR